MNHFKIYLRSLPKTNLLTLLLTLPLVLLLPITHSPNLQAETADNPVNTGADFDIVALTKAWLDVFPEGKFDDYPGKISPEFTLIIPFLPPGVPREYKGRENARAMLQHTATTRSKLEFHEVVILKTEDPNLVLTTAKGEAVLNTGRIYRNELIMLTRFQDGAIIEHIEYFNPLAVMESMKE